MKKNNFTELKAEPIAKLKDRLAKEKKELLDLKMELALKKLKNTRKIFHKRKDISKILTLINQSVKKGSK